MILSMSAGIDSTIQFITVFIIFIFVLGITYITTRYIANIQKNQLSCKNMELVETLRISNNKYLQIVKTGSKYLCIAVCKDTVTMLVELNEDDIHRSHTQDVSFNFHNIFEKVRGKSCTNNKETNEDYRRLK